MIKMPFLSIITNYLDIAQVWDFACEHFEKIQILSKRLVCDKDL